eukprot:2348823-Rhodomonas_salina.2
MLLCVAPYPDKYYQRGMLLDVLVLTWGGARVYLVRYAATRASTDVRVRGRWQEGIVRLTSGLRLMSGLQVLDLGHNALGAQGILLLLSAYGLTRLPSTDGGYAATRRADPSRSACW